MDTRPPLPLPNQYAGIGVWKQIIQVNQHICHKMEHLTQMNQGSSDKKEVWIINAVICPIQHWVNMKVSYSKYLIHGCIISYLGV